MRSRLSRRALLVLLVAALAATAARLAAPSEAHPTKPSRTLICGSERWRVKTLQDRPKLYSAKPKTVAWLMGLKRPKPTPKNRSNFERHIYSVEAAVTDVLQEADKDLHVVLEDGPAHMVAESPNAPVTGRAPNSIELHPILDFACLTTRPRRELATALPQTQDGLRHSRRLPRVPHGDPVLHRVVAAHRALRPRHQLLSPRLPLVAVSARAGRAVTVALELS